MCAVGGDSDAVWSEMMEEWQLHLVRLGYVRAVLEAFVRVLYPDGSQPATTIERARVGADGIAVSVAVRCRPSDCRAPSGGARRRRCP
jgi:hypothetical protein